MKTHILFLVIAFGFATASSAAVFHCDVSILDNNGNTLQQQYKDIELNGNVSEDIIFNDSAITQTFDIFRLPRMGQTVFVSVVVENSTHPEMKFSYDLTEQHRGIQGSMGLVGRGKTGKMQIWCPRGN